MLVIKNNEWARTGDEKYSKEIKIAALDMGACFNNFAVGIDFMGKIYRVGGLGLKELCKKAIESSKDASILEARIAMMANKLVSGWKEKGVTDVVIGCCQEDYLQLCHNNSENWLYKTHTPEIFVESLREICTHEHIIFDSKFNEAFTSSACSLTSDVMPLGKKKDPKIIFNGIRSETDYNVYLIYPNLIIDANVNAAANIARKYGATLRFEAWSEYVRSIKKKAI